MGRLRESDGSCSANKWGISFESRSLLWRHTSDPACARSQTLTAIPVVPKRRKFRISQALTTVPVVPKSRKFIISPCGRVRLSITVSDKYATCTPACRTTVGNSTSRGIPNPSWFECAIRFPWKHCPFLLVFAKSRRVLQNFSCRKADDSDNGNSAAARRFGGRVFAVVD